MPWAIFLRAGVAVAVACDGRVRCLAGKTAVEAVEAVEDALRTRAGAAWTDEAQFAQAPPEVQVHYGTPGRAAQQLGRAPVFR
eukprot:8674137-Pyramimonas_sp.AAC.1